MSEPDPAPVSAYGTAQFRHGWTVARAECRRLVNVYILEMLDQKGEALMALRDGHGSDRRVEFDARIAVLEAVRDSITEMEPCDQTVEGYSPRMTAAPHG